MKPYSMDLRQRVIDAYEAGAGSQRELAQRFDLALSTVHAWIKRYRQTGSVSAKPTGGSKPKLDEAAQAHLRQVIEKNPDATLAEWASAFQAVTGLSMHPVTLWRYIKRLGLSRKRI